MQPVYLLLGLGVGAVMALYLPLVGTMGRALGSPVLATVPFFIVGLSTALIATVATGQVSDLSRIRSLSLWLPLTGIGAFLMIVGSAHLIPRIGASLFFVVVVAGQLLVGAVVAHYGLLGSATVPLTLQKLAGLALVITGAWLAVR
ncbi:DMT family transporter [Acuticoccus sp. MNP-M23]|uniref:DMT family transporter n=1 Tax=Acuticoccus sp. MNP-M23 TaxID=3072793 RepID=UPI0028149C3E|nr:DMT family transporter [Acuticoccus sp. MNP-M23]WMS41412.1 DMT family transporter [Acuticoccus sp. MNP-M23]